MIGHGVTGKDGATDAWRMWPTIKMALSVGGTMVALGLVVHELWHQDILSLAMLAGGGFGFWAALIASLFVEPVTDYATLRRLMGTGMETLAPLVHKQSLNALLFGYAGDVFFLDWLRGHVADKRAALALVCDMAILSAMVNNIAALGMLALMWPHIQLLAGVTVNIWTLSLAMMLVAVPVLLIAVRRRKLPQAGLPTILAFKVIRTIVATVLVALTWHYALPSVPLLSWLLLLTGRMVVSRLPIVPNKDLAFAGCVSILLGPNDQVVPVIAAVALFTLAVQAIMIASFSLAVLPRRTATA